MLANPVELGSIPLYTPQREKSSQGEAKAEGRGCFTTVTVLVPKKNEKRNLDDMNTVTFLGTICSLMGDVLVIRSWQNFSGNHFYTKISFKTAKTNFEHS